MSLLNKIFSRLLWIQIRHMNLGDVRYSQGRKEFTHNGLLVVQVVPELRVILNDFVSSSLEIVEEGAASFLIFVGITVRIFQEV